MYKAAFELELFDVRYVITPVESTDVPPFPKCISSMYPLALFAMDFANASEKLADNIASFVTGAYCYQGVTWNVFRLSLLANDRRFLDVAV